jgi:hypothetical protein
LKPKECWKEEMEKLSCNIWEKNGQKYQTHSNKTEFHQPYEYEIYEVWNCDKEAVGNWSCITLTKWTIKNWNYIAKFSKWK